MASIFGAWKRAVAHPVTPVTWAALSCTLAIVGPFGTYETVPLWWRAAVAPLYVGGAVLLGLANRAFVEVRRGAPETLSSSLVIALLNALILTPPMMIVGAFLAPFHAVSVPFHDYAGLIFVASLGVSAVRHALIHPPPEVALPVPAMPPADLPEATPEPEPASVPPEQAPPVPRLILRLPEPRRAALLHLSVDDHYVVIHTAIGTDKVLMRFADAMAETDPVDGVQVHRSHWVAVAAVIGSAKQSGKITLTLCDGAEVPVSRKFRDLAERRGLI